MTKQPIRVRCSGKARRDGVENGRTSQPWARVSRGLSCTHVHEVLTPMATVVHQALPFGHDPEGKVALTPDPALTEKPFFVDDCHSWRADGPVVARFNPQFSRRKS